MKRSLILLTALCISFSIWQGCHKKNGPSPSQLADKCAYRFADPLDSCWIYLPTAFTPNGDGMNDLYRFIQCYAQDSANQPHVSAWNEIASYHEAIYKTDGSLINQGINLVNGWDGRDSSGNLMPAAKYYVTVKYTTVGGISVDTGTYVFIMATDTVHHCIINNTDSTNLFFEDRFDPATGGEPYPTVETFCN